MRLSRLKDPLSALFPRLPVWLGALLSRRLEEILDAADVRIDGDRPWDMQIRDDRLFLRVLFDRSVGLGDAYIDGWWECAQLDELMFRLLSLHVERTVGLGVSFHMLEWLGALHNMQSRSRAGIVARRHYDLPSEFYMSFLDPYNQYTCGYFQDTDDLAVAQENKLDLLCRKLEIKPGERVLDIGCGWGGFARFAAERHGAHVTGITVSEEQLAYARKFTEGLSVELCKRDYRDMTGTFDKVLVCGMIEHVGYKNYRTLMEVVSRCLAPGGLFLVQTIGSNDSVRSLDPWLDKHIFPNAMLPSIRQLADAAEGLFVMEDLHNLRTHYISTLLAWYRNFDRNWSRLADRYDDRIYRTWKYYFLFCAGIFRAGNAQLWQIVFSRAGVPRSYVSIRT
ncbi:MAG: cyclopropane fatty acyl phospholipid synthase [Proteobacteria bacterium]|nr:cyclopropane fatty acyl phospholipid synthase [Pseudomonadota bacterium]